MAQGRVILVGAGPGEPGLITVRGLSALRMADVVVFDALVDPQLLKEVKVRCKLVDAGKRAGEHYLRQQEIDQVLVRESRKGKLVVRLKGGDPFIFGRGGEEATLLKKANIPYEMVPGVSSAIAVPAYAGIPLTHRDTNSTVTLITGHGQERGAAALDWASLAKLEPLVILMGIRKLQNNVRHLLKHGKSRATPVAVIQWGTWSKQKMVIGTLANIVQRVKQMSIGAPAIIVVGKNVNFAKTLAWLESRPLWGRRVLVTRAREQASELATALRGQGAIPIEIPTIELRPPRSFAPLDRALKRIAHYDWVFFTSANGVQHFCARLTRKGMDARTLAGLRVAAIGPATAAAVKTFGIKPDFIATDPRAEGLLSGFQAKKIRDQNILIARAEQGREILPEMLKKRGARVTVVSCYCSVAPVVSRRPLQQLIDQEPPDLVVFASSSMAKNFITLLGKNPTRLRKARQIPAACIGPITRQTAKQLHFKKTLMPRTAGIIPLVETIERYFSR